MSIFDGVNTPSIYVAFESSAPFTQVPESDIYQIAVSRGRSSVNQEYSVGTLSLTLNNESGIYDPNFTGTSPYVSGGVSTIKKGQMMFFLMKIDGYYWSQFFGFLQNVTINQGVSPVSTFTFTDGLDLLGSSDFPPSFYKRDAETTDDRVFNALAYAPSFFAPVTNLVGSITNAYGTGTAVTYTCSKNYVVGQTVSIGGVNPSAYNLTDQVITAVGSGSFTVANGATGAYVSGGVASIKHVQMQATLGDGTPIGTIRQAAACEGIDFYLTTMGLNSADTGNPATDTSIYESNLPNLIFEPIANKFNKVTRLAFSDSLASDFLTYDTITTDDGTNNYINKATFEYPNFNSTATNQVTAYYGDGDIADDTVYVPVANSYAATNLAVYSSRKLATPTPSVKSLSFQALGAQQSLYWDLLQLDLQDQITVSRTTAQTQDYDLVVEGITHHITPTSWRVTLSTSAMNPYYTVIDKSGG